MQQPASTRSCRDVVLEVFRRLYWPSSRRLASLARVSFWRQKLQFECDTCATLPTQHEQRVCCSQCTLSTCHVLLLPCVPCSAPQEEAWPQKAANGLQGETHTRCHLQWHIEAAGFGCARCSTNSLLALLIHTSSPVCPCMHDRWTAAAHTWALQRPTTSGTRCALCTCQQWCARSTVWSAGSASSAGSSSLSANSTQTRGEHADECASELRAGCLHKRCLCGWRSNTVATAQPSSQTCMLCWHLCLLPCCGCSLAPVASSHTCAHHPGGALCLCCFFFCS